jgi:homoserine acetyltransferase
MIVKSRTLKLAKPFITEKGDVIKEADVAYETYGQEDKPAVFITHGGLSSHHAAGMKLVLPG